MACECGHAPEDHEDETGPCDGTYRDHGKEHPCKCVAYEEAAEDDD